jgi:hypothetical protein
MNIIETTKEYFDENFVGVPSFLYWYELLSYDLSIAKNKGLNLEFGTASGNSINYLARTEPHSTFHGFDSFLGLPESWHSWQVGTFSQNGVLPAVERNVVLHKGWFNETLADFLSANPEPIRFLHMDADLYSSTSFVLNMLADRIQPKTVIAFDEYWNYPTWLDHEYKASQEFVEKNNVAYHYLGYTTYSGNNLQVSVMIDSIGQTMECIDQHNL